MKLLPLLFIILALNHNQLQSQSQNLTGAFILDTTNTQIEFSAKHFGVLNVKGTFHQFTGQLVLNNGRITAGSLVIKTSSITTWNKGRDRSLKSEDILNEEAFPEIKLKVIPGNSNQKTIPILGNIKGVNSQVQLSYKVQMFDSSMFQISGECTISRKAFQLDFGHMDDLVSDALSIRVTFSFKQKNP